MTEHDLKREFTKSLERTFPEGFIHSIPDSYDTGKKPFDIMAYINGVGYGFELKQLKGLWKFNVNSKVPPHQIEGLKAIEKNGGIGYLIVHYWVKKERINICLYQRVNEIRDIERDEVLNLPSLKRVKGIWTLQDIIKRV